ncbi:Uu.00g073330.m01.CDS01 [Anthostomella pinea]|uniref:Uu.00g073330.m01.CDS01 n=1 Tax=Anthostomella pinea TaxID=933095 RepID=A0AAI8VVB3_9PEZI|nr:Uu.00g073330.m01.CDS01 [Anthostomella pinea]
MAAQGDYVVMVHDAKMDDLLAAGAFSRFRDDAYDNSIFISEGVDETRRATWNMQNFLLNTGASKDFMKGATWVDGENCLVKRGTDGREILKDGKPQTQDPRTTHERNFPQSGPPDSNNYLIHQQADLEKVVRGDGKKADVLITAPTDLQWLKDLMEAREDFAIQRFFHTGGFNLNGEIAKGYPTSPSTLANLDAIRKMAKERNPSCVFVFANSAFLHDRGGRTVDSSEVKPKLPEDVFKQATQDPFFARTLGEMEGRVGRHQRQNGVDVLDLALLPANGNTDFKSLRARENMSDDDLILYFVNVLLEPISRARFDDDEPLKSYFLDYVNALIPRIPAQESQLRERAQGAVRSAFTKKPTLEMADFSYVTRNHDFLGREETRRLFLPIRNVRMEESGEIRTRLCSSGKEPDGFGYAGDYLLYKYYGDDQSKVDRERDKEVLERLASVPDV